MPYLEPLFARQGMSSRFSRTRVNIQQIDLLHSFPTICNSSSLKCTGFIQSFQTVSNKLRIQEINDYYTGLILIMMDSRFTWKKPSMPSIRVLGRMTNDAKCTKRALMQFVDNAGHNQHIRACLSGSLLFTYRIS